MFKAVIFAGTTEGRVLAECCCRWGIEAGVSVASHYGGRLLPVAPFLSVQEGPMDEKQMERWIQDQGASLVLDATHPYAAEATANIRAACEAADISYVRVVRRRGAQEQSGGVVYFPNVEEAAKYLDAVEGDVLITTGSKELKRLAVFRDFRRRAYVRVLPSAAVLAECAALGLEGRQIIAMQGPFSVELNSAILRQMGVRYLVTKEAGAAGGYDEKLAAARECGVTALVVERPVEEEGISAEEAMRLLERHRKTGRRIFLIGIGMGGRGQMTVEAVQAVKGCDLLLGAPRMLEHIREYADLSAHREAIYAGGEVYRFIREHGEYGRIGVIYSGDTGFYSGAGTLLRLLREEGAEQYEWEVLPGISSVSALCAKAGTTWEDIRLVSAHGRFCDLMGEIAGHRRVFALLGGDYTAERLCRDLAEAGERGVRLTVGERLSYPDERVVTGTPEELLGQAFGRLSVVLLERRDEDEG